MNGRRAKLIRAVASSGPWPLPPGGIPAVPTYAILAAVGVDTPAVRRKLARELRRSLAPEVLAGPHPVRPRKRPTISGPREFTRSEALAAAAELRAEAHAAEAAAAAARPRVRSRAPLWFTIAALGGGF